MTKTTAIIALAFLSLRCHAQSLGSTEIFHLRAECAQLGDQLIQRNFAGGGSWRSGDGAGRIDPPVSYYDNRDNHCYTKVTVLLVDPQFRGMYTNLYDAATNQVLAGFRLQEAKQSKAHKLVPAGLVTPPESAPLYRTWIVFRDATQKLRPDLPLTEVVRVFIEAEVSGALERFGTNAADSK